eukprot:gnl/TRDRNA2_/TRDRNA2_172476_c3_seq1.p2 gnl/TRDRNA2_/TRDRNA2_172476_c3~~gnl/TRDRNA2_/TRDRNA2_172476_c3_seq1.p2  ORF type:complete len:108 (+),score=3.59 gnl/TRDRNA2_/TRDRNA2_172476_c3_seq1:355-678(+)
MLELVFVHGNSFHDIKTSACLTFPSLVWKSYMHASHMVGSDACGESTVPHKVCPILCLFDIPLYLFDILLRLFEILLCLFDIPVYFLNIPQHLVQLQVSLPCRHIQY